MPSQLQSNQTACQKTNFPDLPLNSAIHTRQRRKRSLPTLWLSPARPSAAFPARYRLKRGTLVSILPCFLPADEAIVMIARSCSAAVCSWRAPMLLLESLVFAPAYSRPWWSVPCRARSAFSHHTELYMCTLHVVRCWKSPAWEEDCKQEICLMVRGRSHVIAPGSTVGKRAMKVNYISLAGNQNIRNDVIQVEAKSP